MLANILSSKRQFQEGVELDEAVGKNGRQHQDPMQQASCDTPKTLVVIVFAIAGHREAPTNEDGDNKQKRVLRSQENEGDGLKERIADEESIMFGSDHVDERNNEGRNDREDGAGAENEAIVDEKASGPANGQKERRHSVGLDNEVVEDFAGANGPSANLKSPFADFVCVVGARGRTVDGNEIQRPDADFSSCEDGVANQGNDILHLIGRVGKGALLQQLDTEGVMRHGIDVPRNQNTHEEKGSQNTGDVDKEGHGVALVDDDGLPDGGVAVGELQLGVLGFELQHVFGIENGVAVAVGEDVFVFLVVVIDILTEDLEALTTGVVHVGTLATDFTRNARGVEGDDEAEEFALVLGVDFIAFGFLVGCAAFHANDDGEAGFGILLLHERVQGGLQYAHGFLVQGHGNYVTKG